jgi:hypothetical protein|tara:strand:- start:370 stop:618 length:249 start_codon:yes stop_codon:yes gene_type:complete
MVIPSGARVDPERAHRRARDHRHFAARHPDPADALFSSSAAAGAATAASSNTIPKSLFMPYHNPPHRTGKRSGQTRENETWA